MPDDTKPDEPQYTDPETGKPIVYADNVPELLQGLTEENCGFAMNDPRFEELDAMTHLARAKQGAEEWNCWVQWAELKDGRWLVRQERQGSLHVDLKQIEGSQYEDDFFQKNGIDFAAGQSLDEDGRIAIENGDFEGFIFPCTVSFIAISFEGGVSFVGAFFSCDVWFSRARLESRSNFHNLTVCGDLIMSGVHFGQGVWFPNSIFKGDCWFEDIVAVEGFSFAHSCVEGDFWAPSAHIEKFATFSNATFRGTTYIAGASFTGDASFNGTVFCEDVSFNTSVFLAAADWNNACFKKSSSWRGCQFGQKSRFENSQFLGSADFDHAWFGKDRDAPFPYRFEKWPDHLKLAYMSIPETATTSKTVPDLKGAFFSVAPNLGYTIVAAPVAQYGKWWQLSKNIGSVFLLKSRTQDSNASAKFRRLQELAAAGHHNLAEKRFFRNELLCRRGHEAKTWREVSMINLFELFSMCGLSFRRPLAWWLGLFAVFFAVYGGFAGLFEAGWSVEDSFHLVNYTFSNATPVLGVIKASDSAAVQALFNGDQPPWVTLLAGVHNLISTIFLFFALLAIRNYFKLG